MQVSAGPQCCLPQVLKAHGSRICSSCVVVVTGRMAEVGRCELPMWGLILMLVRISQPTSRAAAGMGLPTQPWCD